MAEAIDSMIADSEADTRVPVDLVDVRGSSGCVLLLYVILYYYS